MRTEEENKGIFLFALAIVCLFLFSGCNGTGSDGTDNSEYSLSVEIVGQGTVDPETGGFAAGSEIALTATPSVGWIFSHWQGDATGADNPLTIAMNGSKTVSAVFVEKTYALTTAVVGEGSIDPASGDYAAGSRLSLTAVPAEGWAFSKWEGYASGTDNPLKITLDSKKTIVAVFVDQREKYSLTSEIVGQGAVDPQAGAYAAGSEVELTATPAQGWLFFEWQGDAAGADNPLTMTMDSNKTVSAIFIEQDVKVLMKTTLGDMVFILYPSDAPVTTDNFLQYVEDGFYDGTDGAGATIFHRVIAGFVIQGGGMTEAMVLKTTRDPIAIESDNGLSNKRGTLAMARTFDPNSATSQFYVNLVDNYFLDYVSEAEPGYTVFGELESGFDVLDAIGAVSTTSDVPNDPIFITSVELIQ